jgi:hypothetical protein
LSQLSQLARIYSLFKIAKSANDTHYSINMRSATLSNAALVATLTALASAQGSYILKDDLSYNNFFQNFDFYSGADPTNGFVQYQTKDAATQNQLIGYFEDTQSVFLGVDYKTKDPKGRASVRVESTKSWNQGLLIADIKHMPDSTCGTWPAYWLLGQQNVGTDDWPKGGEIDLLEGVNLDSAAAVTLHTSAGCAVDNATSSIQSRAESAFMGSMSTSNCDVAATNQDKNVGCSIKAPQLTANNAMATYGTDFNKAGGGVYAMEWTDSSISVWFLPRNSTAFAASASNATQTLDPSTFGTPLAKFQGQGCDFEERFKNMRIIFDTTFCGDWAGKEWEESTCAAKTGAKTCEEYVQNNPEAFTNAYWEIAGLKWFEKQGAYGSPAASSVPLVSPAPVSSIPLVSPAPVSSIPLVSPAPVSSAIPGTPPAGPAATPNPASTAISLPSGPLSSVSLALETLSSAINPASSSTAAAPASSSIAAAPVPGNGTGSGSGGGSSPNMGSFIWPTAHAGGGGGGSPAVSSVAGSSPSLVVAPSSAASSIPAASIPVESVPASVPVESVPASSALLNAPTQAARPVVSPIVAVPVDAAPGTATATAPVAMPSVAPPPAATPPAAKSSASTPSAAAPSSAKSSATPSPSSGSGSGSGSATDGSSPNMGDFVWPSKHIKRRAGGHSARHRGRTFRW